jgi:DNA invertase Pin-like site-specific DNA recombinase
MIEFLKKENKKETIVDFVIADDMDRISRDIVGRHNIKYKIEHKGKAKIQTVKQYLEDTPEGQLMQNIVVSMKQYERENNAKRTVSRKRARLLE